MYEQDSKRDGETKRVRTEYVQPRIERSHRLTDVTGQVVVVPSGAPVPPPG